MAPPSRMRRVAATSLRARGNIRFDSSHAPLGWQRAEGTTSCLTVRSDPPNTPTHNTRNGARNDCTVTRIAVVRLESTP
eukprot:scaffold21992_cov100-Phaeocystis_antarctica.AAC.5